jgi:hypothetical protein
MPVTTTRFVVKAMLPILMNDAAGDAQSTPPSHLRSRVVPLK